MIMTVLDGEQYVRAALDSIRSQTFQAWECIVIDDGSTDRTAEILRSFDDPRIRVYSQEHRGRGDSLNRACHSAQGELLAILDADDEARPDRLRQQVEFLDSHPEVGLLGTTAILRTEPEGEERLFRSPGSDAEIRRAVPRYNPLCHSSVMLRRRLYDEIGGYRESLPCALDLDLYVRALVRTRAASLPDPLVVHRIHPQQLFLARTTPATRERTTARIRLGAVMTLGLPRRELVLPGLLYLHSFVPGPLRLTRLKGLFTRPRSED